MSAGSEAADRFDGYVSGLWAEVLGVSAEARSAHFVELGGNSLHAAQIAARMSRDFAVRISARDVFEHPTVTTLTGLLSARGPVPEREGFAPAEVRPVADFSGRGLAASSHQQRIWLMDHLDADAGRAYNVFLALRLLGDLDVPALRGAWRDVVRRHEQLSVSFTTGTESGTETEGIAARPASLDAEVTVLDLTGQPQAGRAAEAEARKLAAEHIDLATPPLARCTVIRVAEAESLLVLVLPHVVSDGRTMDILYRDLERFYRLRTGYPADSPKELPFAYRDFAHWQRQFADGPVADRLMRHWRDRLHGIPAVLELPADRPRPAVYSFRGRRIGMRSGGGLLTAVRELARETRTTPYAVCLAAYGLMLRELTGRSDMVVATPMDGRPDADFEDVVGFFANTVPMPLRLPGGDFLDAVRHAHTVALDAMDHQHVPFERLAAEFAPAHDASRSPLAQVVLAYQGTQGAHREFGDLAARRVPVDNHSAKFDFTVEIFEDGTELDLSAEFCVDLFSEDRARRMLERYVDLLASAVARPEALQPGGAPVREHSESPNGGGCLHEIFAATAARHPAAVAVTDGTRRMTYAELDARANRLAHRLRGHGAGPEQLVGLCAERTVDLAVGVLGILKAGSGYLPLDPRHPAARLKDTLDDSGCRILVGDDASCRPLLDASRDFVGLADPLTDEPATAPSPGAGPDNVAYVIYTSGSTGKPKGVAVTHANVTRLFTATEDEFHFGPDDVWTLFHSVAFDFSVWELWGALLHGGRLAVVPYDVSRDPYAFLGLLRSERVTVLNQTPTAFRQLIAAVEESGFPCLSLRAVVFGGEALDPAMLRRWVDAYGTLRPRLINMYGITETTVHVTIRPISSADLDGAISPIGTPIGDLRVHVLDEDLREVPPNVVGEMYVGGPGVARGYLNRPGLTRERFVPDPFLGGGERLYRSGDLAVRRDGGELEYRGRADQQVKLHGFRIELGEIERALLDQPQVRDAVCVLREDTPGLPRLVGYVVPEQDGAVEPERVRTLLAERLPSYMVPAVFVVLERLPLTINGKLDRKALPAPLAENGPVTAAVDRSGDDTPDREELAAVTGTERFLIGLWERLLGVEGIGCRDEFFALGGHSLLAFRMQNKIKKELGVNLEYRRILKLAVLAELAEAIDAHLADGG